MDKLKKRLNKLSFQKIKKILIFFEANLLMVLDSLDKKKIKSSIFKIKKKLEIVSQRETYQLIIIKTLEDYNNFFRYKKIQETK